jgi:hypothetical protein
VEGSFAPWPRTIHLLQRIASSLYSTFTLNAVLLFSEICCNERFLRGYSSRAARKQFCLTAAWTLVRSIRSVLLISMVWSHTIIAQTTPLSSLEPILNCRVTPTRCWKSFSPYQLPHDQDLIPLGDNGRAGFLETPDQLRLHFRRLVALISRREF